MNATLDLGGGSAVMSACGLYRMRLERRLSASGPVAVILGVNPSTADATKDDATIRKDMGFARRLGFSRIIKGNKFAFRATDVRALRSAADPIGPENDHHLEAMMREADLVIAAWGPLAKLPPILRRRWLDVVTIADRVQKPLYCWGVAADGQPRHPLMLAYDTPLSNWVRPSGGGGEVREGE